MTRHRWTRRPSVDYPTRMLLVLTAFGLVYAAVQYPSGTYSETLSRATLLLPGLFVLLAGVAVVALSVTPWVFVAGVVGLVAELATFEAAFWLLVGCFLTCGAVLARQYRR